MKARGSQFKLIVVDTDRFKLSGVCPHRNTQGCAGSRVAVRINRFQINEHLLYSKEVIVQSKAFWQCWVLKPRPHALKASVLLVGLNTHARRMSVYQKCMNS